MSYIKYHDPWTDSCPLSGAAMNHLESQWTTIKSEADAHNHDTAYYTKTLTDAKFFTTSFYTGFDAATLDGLHFSDIILYTLPKKSILLWSGTDADVPAGYAICNGQVSNGVTTPDLRDRFVPGAGDTYALGATGSSGSPVSISGSFTVNSHSVTADEMPLHTHSFQDYANGSGQNYSLAYRNGAAGSVQSNSGNTGYSGSGTGHTHTGNSISLNAISYLPYYYALYYIEKVV